MREWAIKNPRICTLRLDAKFILRFLRFKKFSIPMAQETLERYLVLRKYFFEGEYIYQNFDYKLPQLLDLINKGWDWADSIYSRLFSTLFCSFVFALPQRDKLGRRVIFYRPKAFNPAKCINHDIIRCNGIVFETLLEDEENQIRGCVHVIDSSGMGLSYVTGKIMTKNISQVHDALNNFFSYDATRMLPDYKKLRSENPKF